MPQNQNPSFSRKINAAVCKYCPLCRAARKNPHSLVGRMLNKPVHADNCPAWQAYQQVYGQNEKEPKEEQAKQKRP